METRAAQLEIRDQKNKGGEFRANNYELVVFFLKINHQESH